MNSIYIIFLLTFLVFPVIGIILSYYIKIDLNSRLIKRIVLFFAVHNILFILGFSLKGDNVDYYIFSIEYFILCCTIFAMPKATNIYTKIFNLLGVLVISIGVIIGLIGILLFIPASQDYNADKKFHFESSLKEYESRRYVFGFATLDNTKYTFKTYREYEYLPFERRIDKTVFFDLKSNLNVSDDDLEISIIKQGNKKQLLFKSSNGQKFLKTLD